MNLMEMLLQQEKAPNTGSPLSQMAGQFGLDQNQVQQALAAILPAMSSGLKNNVRQPGGPEALARALSQGNHERYLERPEQAFEPTGQQDGRAILGHLFGSKDVSRRVSQHAAEKTGLGGDMIQQMLPAIASMVMGSLGRNTKGIGEQQLAQGLSMLGGQQQQQAAPQGGGGGLGGLIGGVLGALGGGRGRQQAPQGLQGGGGQAGGLGALATMLDADGDGSVADDLLGLAQQFMRK